MGLSKTWVRKTAAFLLLALAMALSLRGIARSSDEITVSAAASLKNAFEEIGKALEAQQKGAKIHFNFGASGDLMRQIEGGAPVDVFASAALREMDELERKNMILAGTRHDFIGNSILLIRPAGSGVGIRTFDDLKKQDVKRISIGNPSTVPAGMYAEQTLRYLNLWDAVKDKLIFGENVRQVLDYVARGEVDAGIVFSSDATVRPKQVEAVMQAPEESHKPVVYVIAVVKGTANEALAEKFLNFVLSNGAKRILQGYGFKPLP